MTDAHLMDADCIHGKTWWDCAECDADMASDPAVSEHPIPTTEREAWVAAWHRRKQMEAE